MRRYSAAVIGLGHIGQGYDYDEPRESAGTVLTHAAAFELHPGFELVAGVDPDERERVRFEKKFARAAWPDIDAMLAATKPEVLAIAVPTRDHYDTFKHVIAANPAAILCEKPLAATFEQGQQMVEKAAASRCLLLVNYLRRHEPGVLALKEKLASGDLGELYKAVVWYSKGFANNASHFVDLLTFLVGDPGGFEVISPGRPGEGDPEPDVIIRYGKMTAYFIAAREENFSFCEMEILGEHGRVRYRDSGNRIDIERVETDPLFPQHRRLSAEPAVVATDLARYQWHVADALHQALASGARQMDGRSALRTLEIVTAVAAASRRTQ